MGSSAALRLIRSSVNANHNLPSSSGSSASGNGGGLYGSSLTLTLNGTTIANNEIRADGPTNDATANGGGIDLIGPSSMKATNSTIAGNVAHGQGSPTGSFIGYASGAGASAPSISLTNATVAGNRATASAHFPNSQGGGLKADDVTLRASILAGNSAKSGPDCFATTATSNGHNLIRHNGKCLASQKTSDKIGVSPQLRPLRDNSGPTKTMAIRATSPAFNAIPPASCAVGVDQRGVHRPQGKRCDIGAFERRV